MTEDNREKFLQVAERYNQLLEFHNVEELCGDKLSEMIRLIPRVENSHFSVAMLYRFFIPHILPSEVEKAIYLDADIIVNLNINEFWQIELGDKPLGVVLEVDNGIPPSKYSNMCHDGVVKEENYFNSGVLLMNLKVLRNEDDNILAGIKFTGEHLKYNLVDQEILNYCFETRTFKLPVKFNRLVKQMRIDENFSVNREIYHYAGGKWGLGLDMADPFNRLWWSYFIKTPWFGVDIIDKMLKSTQDSMLQFSVVPYGKARAFVVDEEHAHQIERNFSVQDDEKVIVIDPENEENLQRLEDIMKSDRDKKSFFIGIPNIAPKLMKSGFIEEKDFFDVSGFYSPTWTSRANNYKLILSM